jgi:uncharacterized protein (DUF1499 family)
MIGWIALAITLLVIAAVAWQIDDWSRDWTQNTAELSKDADRPELRPLHLQVDARGALERIRQWVDDQPAWEVVNIVPEKESPRTIHLTRTTRWFRFVDDIHVTLRDDESGRGVVLDAHSQSRIGKGDLGQNPRNLMELTRGLRGESRAHQ